MRHYLHRAFAEDARFRVLHDVRIEDPDQPEHTGSAGIAQIDHLVLHRWGAFIVESKSVSDRVVIRGDGSGGDEWVRVTGRKRVGMRSPIRQAEDQARLLRRYLDARSPELLGLMPVGLRTVSKIINKTDQRGFRHMPIQIIVAISDNGMIERPAGWKEPTDPFRVYVCKADLVVSKIKDEIGRHRQGDNLLAPRDGNYGMWDMKQEEVGVVAGHLERFANSGELPADRRPVARPANVPPPPPAPIVTAPDPSRLVDRSRIKKVERPSCKSCGSGDLSAHWGRYGYYWKCRSCGVNTSMPTVCSVCGAEGKRGEVVRIRKEGLKYLRSCSACGIDERIWQEPG